MQEFILKAVAAGLGLAVSAHYIRGVKFSDTGSLIVAAILLGVVNAIVLPVAQFLTFPLTIITLGLFLFVLNGLMLWLVAALMKGFEISGLWPAVLASIVVSVVSFIVLKIIEV